ncbi:hypothetical protein N7517_003605 [Penicillium concentricum]|uniref:Uncharacterized protein n=1 Tax=Penicillium concentricum TaxID=293559 RepID=A0A9W9S6K7_9EURO|nr:uncharacterized protein N7517_003605 [Penicillium concentricum]KAJ5371599.1 hypothetical protein N7517_003605 [Penicillium concentricum]
MSLVNTIPAESYLGTIGGISVSWNPNAITNLPANAEAYRVELKALKSTTETVAVACARRIRKTSVRILGSFHDSTTNLAAGEITEDACHCSISLKPGGAKAHIYVTNLRRVPIESMRLLGESIILKGSMSRDPNLSIGSLPVVWPWE